MKILISCPECIALNYESNAATLTLGNGSVYKATCERGHEQAVSLPHQKHEILFEFGVYAIIDGYYREAISSFAAALERYYEYFLRVVTLGEYSEESFENAWKQVSSQSERQLGGYIFSHLIMCGRPPNLLSNSLITLRNRAIHKGYIPSKEEAMQYGDGVSKLIIEGVSQLHRRYGDKMREITRQTLYPDGVSVSDRIHIHETYLRGLAERDPDCFYDYVSSIRTHNQPRY